MSQQKKNTLYMQGLILACAGIVTKIIGFIYRIPMANILGNQGNGIYSVAYGIYNIALTLSSYSLPLAVSKLVSTRLAKKEYKNAYRVLVFALFFAIVVGALACGLLYSGADFLERLYNRQGLALPLRILAPTTFVVAVLGVFRGFFQGHSNMVPTALSQILEQIVNAVVSVVAAWQFTVIFSASDVVYAYGAAGGTLGTLAGAVAALALFIFIYFVNRPILKKRNALDSHGQESAALIYKALILTVVPVILSQTIYQIGYTIDDMLFGNIMARKGIDESVAASMQGVFNTQYNQLINLPVAVATAMAASSIPSIVRSHVSGNVAEVNQRIDGVVKFNMVIAIPSAVGLAVLGGPIVALLFPRLSDYQDMAAALLMYGSSAVVFYALSTITTAIIQAASKMRIPVMHSAISLTLHIILVYALLKYTPLGVYGLLIGNVIFPIVVSLLNCRFIKKTMHHSWDIRKTFVLPLIAATVMGIACLICYKVLYMLVHINALAMLAAIALAVVVYGILILKFRCFTREELLELPMGRKIVKIAKM